MINVFALASTVEPRTFRCNSNSSWHFSWLFLFSFSRKRISTKSPRLNTRLDRLNIENGQTKKGTKSDWWRRFHSSQFGILTNFRIPPITVTDSESIYFFGTGKQKVRTGDCCQRARNSDMMSLHWKNLFDFFLRAAHLWTRILSWWIVTHQKSIVCWQVRYIYTEFSMLFFHNALQKPINSCFTTYVSRTSLVIKQD